MDIIHLKKIIAREWLILLIAILIGIILSVFLFFIGSSEYLVHRRNLYESLNYKYQENKLLDLNISPDEYRNRSELQKFRKKYPQYNDLDDSTLASKLAAKISRYL